MAKKVDMANDKPKMATYSKNECISKNKTKFPKPLRGRKKGHHKRPMQKTLKRSKTTREFQRVHSF